MFDATGRNLTIAITTAAVLLTAALAFSGEENGETSDAEGPRVASASSDDGTGETNEEAAGDRQESESDEKRPRLDVAFVVDATGSMSDEIEVIKKQVWSIANDIASGDPTPKVRFGLVFYRDKTDEFVVRKTELTRDIDAIHRKLMKVSAAGGGDHREHVLKALDTALKFDWEKGSKVSRSIYLVGDAAAHTDYQDGYSISGILERARNRSIAIHSIGCSGIKREAGREQFAKLSEETKGTYEALTYHAVVEDEEGDEKSVVYHEGRHYEADEKLEDEEWSRGAEKLKESGRLEPASPESERKAESSADKKNNLDAMMKRGIKKEASEMGVAY